jgi:hypothetical protein
MMSPSSVSIKAEVVVTLLLPNGPMGTAAVTERYSGSTSAGEADAASVTSHEVADGPEVTSFFVTNGWRFWKVVWSWRRATANLRLTEAGSGVSVVRVCVEVKTRCYQ